MKHSVTLTELKKAAVRIVGYENAIGYRMKLEKDEHNGEQRYHFKLTLSIYKNKRTQVKQFIYYADTKKQLLMNMMELESEDEIAYCFEPFCF